MLVGDDIVDCLDDEIVLLGVNCNKCVEDAPRTSEAGEAVFCSHTCQDFEDNQKLCACAEEIEPSTT